VCDFGPSPACGHKLIVVNCQWSTAAGGTCSPRIPPSLTPFVEGCT
jgi:hypothetical protein